MIGIIGVLRQDNEQVGGIFNWSIDATLADGIQGRWKSPKAIKKVTARSYWLVKEPDSNIFEVEFYQQVKGQLVLMDAGKVKLKLPDTTTLDKKLLAPLTLRWIWDD